MILVACPTAASEMQVKVSGVCTIVALLGLHPALLTRGLPQLSIEYLQSGSPHTR